MVHSGSAFIAAVLAEALGPLSLLPNRVAEGREAVSGVEDGEQDDGDEDHAIDLVSRGTEQDTWAEQHTKNLVRQTRARPA